MSNVLDRVRDAIAMANAAQKALEAVTGTIADGREAVSIKRLDEMNALLEREKLETKQAASKLSDAIAAYRKRQAARS
jgi:20S proteasome alpha/beta subunit